MSAARAPERAPRAVRVALADLFTAALVALEPARAVRRALRGLRGGRVLVIGAGKGAAGLAAAVEATLGHAVTGGLVIVPPGYERPLARVEVVTGGHPLPDRRSTAATRRLLRLLERTPADVSVVVALTGGASSLLALPAPGVTLGDKRRLGQLLLASGASIAEANAVRKHLSAVKGGRLAARLRGRDVRALVISDVPGDDLAVVGSGPMVSDPTTFADARRVLVRYGLARRAPARVRARLARGCAGAVDETPKPGAPALARVRTVLLASNATARAAALRAARAAGFGPVVNVRTPLVGSPRSAAELLVRRMRALRRRLRGVRPALLVAGGETTVRLGPNAGRGGRNQELALEVARALAARRGWALLSAGTDGIDGPTDAAGAFADGSTVARAARAGRSLDAALARHDAYPLLAALGDLHRPGPTGTNVADLVLALVWRDRGWRLPGRVCYKRGAS